MIELKNDRNAVAAHASFCHQLEVQRGLGLDPSANSTHTEQDVKTVLATVKENTAEFMKQLAAQGVACNINTGSCSRYPSFPTGDLGNDATDFDGGQLGRLYHPPFAPPPDQQQHSGTTANYFEGTRWLLGPTSKYRDKDGLPFTNTTIFDRSLFQCAIVYVGPGWLCNMVESMLIVMWNNSVCAQKGAPAQVTNNNNGGIGDLLVFLVTNARIYPIYTCRSILWRTTLDACVSDRTSSFGIAITASYHCPSIAK
jgi:hypothetical protein